MIQLKIPNVGEMRLSFSECEKFSNCKLSFVAPKSEISVSEDYLYIFVENMLCRIQNMPTIENEEFLGKIGKWQEFFYYDSLFTQSNSVEISLMKKSLFISTEDYGIFLYQHEQKVWMEINRGYDESCELSPMEYYSNSDNYRVLLTVIPRDTLNEWERVLKTIREKYLVIK